MQGARVQSLVGELRFHLSHGVTGKKKKSNIFVWMGTEAAAENSYFTNDLNFVVISSQLESWQDSIHQHLIVIISPIGLKWQEQPSLNFMSVRSGVLCNSRPCHYLGK